MSGEIINVPPEGEPYDNGYLRSGWSMTVGELRKALEGMDDDTEVVLDQGDCEIMELHIDKRLPKSPMGQVGLVVIEGGQIISSEYDYDKRLDMYLDFGGEHWQDREREWR